jgi:hypothetical protein
MSISPPSDIVLDVARAADPVRYKEAAEKLTRLAFDRTQESLSADAASAFDNALADVGEELAEKVNLAPRPIIQMPFDAAEAMARLKTETALSSGMTVATAAAGGAAETYRGFEAMFLSGFVESVLPKGSNAVFGAGSAGQIWRSMLAEQIAAQMAQSGGIGIADQLQASAEKTAAQSADANNSA